MINNKGQNNPRVHLNAKASLNNTKPVQVKDGNSYANQANRFINSNQQNLKVNNPKLFLNNPQYISIINKVEQMQGRSYITSDHNNNNNYMSQNKDGGKVENIPINKNKMRLPSSGAVESRAYQKSKIMNPNVYEKHFSIDAGGPQDSDNKAKRISSSQINDKKNGKPMGNPSIIKKTPELDKKMQEHEINKMMGVKKPDPNSSKKLDKKQKNATKKKKLDLSGTPSKANNIKDEKGSSDQKSKTTNNFKSTLNSMINNESSTPGIKEKSDSNNKEVKVPLNRNEKDKKINESNFGIFRNKNSKTNIEEVDENQEIEDNLKINDINIKKSMNKDMINYNDLKKEIESLKEKDQLLIKQKDDEIKDIKSQLDEKKNLIEKIKQLLGK